MFAFMLWYCVAPNVCEKRIYDAPTVVACETQRKVIADRHKNKPILRVSRCMRVDEE